MPQLFGKTYLINNWLIGLSNKALDGGEAYVDVNYIPFGENEVTGVKNVANSDIYAAQNFNIVKFLKQINADLKSKKYEDGSGKAFFDDSIVPNASADGFMMDTGYTLSNFTLSAQLIDFFVRTDFDASAGCVTGEVTEVNGKTTTIITKTGIRTLLVFSILFAPMKSVSKVATTTMMWKGTTEYSVVEKVPNHDSVSTSIKFPVSELQNALSTYAMITA